MTFLAANLLVALLALLLERWLGYPDWLVRVLGHPVTWIGAVISFAERRLNRSTLSDERRKLAGTAFIILLVLFVFLIASLVSGFLRAVPGGLFLEALLASTLLAQKSLRQFVARVFEGLAQSLEKGREAVRHIVGRDPNELDESGVSKAAVESLAENTSDGITAPLIWIMVLGLPGGLVYKAINTADSMIGYKSERYLHFGWAAARLDDVVNYPASRLTGLLFVVTAWSSRLWDGAGAHQAMMRDARHHVSPNAGWPEAALAGALGLMLGGARTYQGRLIDLPTMGQGRANLKSEDIKRALTFYGRALWLLTASVFVALLGALSLSG